MVFTRALNKYLETEELDYEKLQKLSSSLGMDEKVTTSKVKTESLKASDKDEMTVKTEQKPTVSISKFKRDLKISGQIGDVSQKNRLSFSWLVHQIENGLKNEYTEDEIKESGYQSCRPNLKFKKLFGGKN